MYIVVPLIAYVVKTIGYCCANTTLKTIYFYCQVIFVLIYLFALSPIGLQNSHYLGLVY